MMNRTLTATFMASLSMLGVPASAASENDLDAVLKELRTQIEVLQSRQKVLERRISEQPAPSAPSQQPAGQTAGSDGSVKARSAFTDALPRSAPPNVSLRALQLPGTDTWLRIGGMLKVDMIDDLDQVMGDQSNPGGLAISGAAANRTQSFRMLARQSRFFIDTSTAIGDDRLHTFVEADFYGAGGGSPTGANAYNLALRHAYAEYGPLLIGQTWSTFMDLETQPEGIDNSGPTGRSAVRQAMLRYTRTFGSNAVQFAIENPESDFNGADHAVAGVPSVNVKNRYPDIVAAWRNGGDWGHVRLAGVARRLGVQDGVNVSSSTNGWGLEFSGRFKPMATDTLGWQLNGGRGIGRYLQDATNTGGNLGADGKLVPQYAAGGVVSWQHLFSPQLRSNIFAGVTRINNAQPVSLAVASTKTRRISQATANLVWSPLSGVNLGAQFSRYQREVESRDKANANRLQFSAWYFF